MIKLDWQGMKGEIGELMARYNELPRHIAKKHLLAAIKRTGKEGVKVLKSNTPVGKTKIVDGRQKRGGALRRAATVKAVYKGKNAGGYAYGVLGYKYGFESRKAIWMEFGTSNGVAPRGMLKETMAQWGGPALDQLCEEMASALEKAVKEVAGGKNPGWSGGG